MYGLVLEGGGAKGAYHVGAYKALMELGVEIGGIAGTSIGALNGALLVQGDLEKLEDIWVNTKSSDLFNIDEKALNDLRNFNLQEINLPYILSVSKDILINGGLDITKIRELLEEYIDEDAIRKSSLDFGIVTVNLTDKKSMELLKEDIPEGKLVDYLLASANFPAFKQEMFDGKKFLDGGFHDNLPIGVLVKKGYKDFIAVRTFGIGIIKKQKLKSLNIIYIQPVEQLGGILDFNKEQAERDMLLGYFDAIKAIKKLKGYKYYCEPYNGDFIRFMSDFVIERSDKIENLGKILGYKGFSTERMLFEKIMPRLESIFDMKGKYDYQDIILRLVEQIAEKYSDIEKFRIYKAEEFIKLVIEQVVLKPLQYNENLPDFIKHNRLLSLAVKDSLINEVFTEMFL